MTIKKLLALLKIANYLETWEDIAYGDKPVIIKGRASGTIYIIDPRDN